MNVPRDERLKLLSAWEKCIFFFKLRKYYHIGGTDDLIKPCGKALKSWVDTVIIIRLYKYLLLN